MELPLDLAGDSESYLTLHIITNSPRTPAYLPNLSSPLDFSAKGRLLPSPMEDHPA
jgi:hypothetical protein